MKTPKIQESENYESFKTILGNRIVNENKIEKLMKDINEGLNLLSYCPIIVYIDGENKMIVDGQHRFEASKSLGFPVYYVECNELTLQQIARINSRSDKWSNRDFLSCYVRLGIEEYEILSEFMSKHNLVYSTAVDFLMIGKISNKVGCMESFRDGEFTVNYLEETTKLVELTADVFGRYKFYSNKNLITAVQKIVEAGKCDFKLLKSKISQAPNIMDVNATPKEYIYNIERVYNFRNANRVTII